MQRNSTAALVVLGLIAVGVAGRIMPHPPNFAPVMAVALFAGLWVRNRWAAAAVPMITMLVSDSLIGSYQWQVMATVYGTLLVSTLVGRGLVGRGLSSWGLSVVPRAWRLAITACGMSVLFFVTTNAATWAFAGYYERSLAGLVACFVAAVPFFKYTLAGDVAYCTGLAMIGVIVARVWPIVEARLDGGRLALALVRVR